MKVRRGAVVIVDWLDAVTEAAGWGPHDKGGPSKVRSVGFLMSWDKAAIVLAGDGAPKDPHKDEVNRTITIPLGMVQRVREVRLSETRRIDVSRRVQ